MRLEDLAATRASRGQGRSATAAPLLQPQPSLTPRNRSLKASFAATDAPAAATDAAATRAAAPVANPATGAGSAAGGAPAWATLRSWKSFQHRWITRAEPCGSNTPRNRSLKASFEATDAAAAATDAAAAVNAAAARLGLGLEC